MRRGSKPLLHMTLLVLYVCDIKTEDEPENIKWSSDNKLQLNLDKTIDITLRSSNVHLEYCQYGSTY